MEHEKDGERDEIGKARMQEVMREERKWICKRRQKRSKSIGKGRMEEVGRLWKREGVTRKWKRGAIRARYMLCAIWSVNLQNYHHISPPTSLFHEFL